MHILPQGRTARRGKAFEYALFPQLKTSPGVFTGTRTKVACEPPDKNLQGPFGAAQSWTQGTQTKSNSQI